MLKRKKSTFKQFTARCTRGSSHQVTVDAEDYARLLPLISGVYAICDGGHQYANYFVNHGTPERPVYESLTNFIMQTGGKYCAVLKDRTDPGDHRKANLRRI